MIKGFIGADDPGAVGAGRYWFDLGGCGSFVLRRRNAMNTGWDTPEELLVTGADPLTVNLTGAALAGTGNLHFEVQISAEHDFSAPIVTANSATSQTGFEFWNGDSVQPFPAEGLPAQYRDAQFGCVMFGWTGASYGTAYYVRIRAWDGATWGEYRVWRITA